MSRQEFMSLVHVQMSADDAQMSADDAQKVEMAYLLANKFHAGQFRKELGPDGKPLRYFEHLRRVALILLEQGVTDKDLICAALLHDAVEDSREIHLVSRLIETVFGPRVSHVVRLVTKIPKQGYLDRLRLGMEATSGLPALVKAADRLDNLRSLPADDPEFRARQIRETNEKILPLLQEAYCSLQFKDGHSFVLYTLIEKIKELAKG
jgi:(p)ppGpp synthase/HD superfamily hydrolase